MHNVDNLARKLGYMETISVDKEISNENKIYNKQNFKFLLVLDFEATCWDKTKQKYYTQPEIIEFPTVLYKIETKEILSEFQQYVMPTEHCKLSEFCKNLTGISQEKVDDGVPLGTCLMLFSNWIQEQEKKYNIILNEKNKMENNCAFVTWSDWDLGTCLLKECKRKRIKKPDYFTSWIDLRALYTQFFGRRPEGLKGALDNLGLEFKGREHCGLDDARNTAFLAGRMIENGVILRITKELK